MIKVLVVEDSPSVLEFLVYIVNAEPGMKVIATATNGEAAIEAVARYKPDVITMDIHMPKMNGFEATRKIMQNCPTPIVIVSGSYETDETMITFQALEAGALMAVSRPTGIGHEKHQITTYEFLQAVKLMSEVKVVRRWPRTTPKIFTEDRLPSVQKPSEDIQIVAIGASTGGPIILETILSALPADFPIPIVVVQHMASSFIQSFAEWLDQSCRLTVKVASQGEVILPKHIYLAPDNYQIKIGIGGKVILSSSSLENGHCPSVSHCFRSIAETYGKHSIGILLSGMGKDGAAELKLLKESGAITIAQDEETCVVFGMPKEAINLGGAQYILSPKQIADFLKNLTNKKQTFS